MAVLKGGGSESIFWGKSFYFITGLDPLGRKTASETIYNWLLPGITNLTQRIRYFGFYCWLIDWYHSTHQRGSQAHLNIFIRRSELLLALMMQKMSPDSSQISGSQFASRWITAPPNDQYFDLKEGADKDGTEKDIYWQLSSGAFGQYYVATLKNLNLLTSKKHKEEKENIYAVTQDSELNGVSGKELAQAFDESLDRDAKEAFLNSIQSGKLNQEDIPLLYNSFSIPDIVLRSSEWSCYKEILLGPDAPKAYDESMLSFNRSNTSKELLRFYRNHGDHSWTDFLDLCYLQHKLGKINTSLTVLSGWYAYRLNELWQFACEILLWSLLKELEVYARPVPHKKFIDDSVKSIQAQTVNISEFSAWDETALAEKLQELSTKGRHWLAARMSFLLIEKITSNNTLETLKEALAQNQLDNPVKELEDLIDIKSKLPFSTSELFQQFIEIAILERHYQEAIRKQGNGSKTTLKYLRDENSLSFAGSFEPSFTTPRLGALKNILLDLKLLENNGHRELSLTPDANPLIEDE